MTSDIEILWPLPPANWQLEAPEIHVWTLALNQPTTQIAALTATLSPEEQTRAARFHFERDQRRFAVGRGWLRTVLGCYLPADPARLQFDYGARGKPELSSATVPKPLHFNLAHSDELAVLAVARACSLGVDVERIRVLNDADGIASRFFSASESAGLNGLPAPEKPAAFFNLWTRKEAWLKATGEGIANSLNQVEVSFLANEPARLLRLPGNAGAAEKWTLRELNPAVGFIGALAFPALKIPVKSWRWPV